MAESEMPDGLSAEEGFFDCPTCALSRALGKGLRAGLVPTHSIRRLTSSHIIDCLFSLLDDFGLSGEHFPGKGC